MPTLTVIDTLGIQRYVFASSRLRDAIGSSFLVHKVTEAATLRRFRSSPEVLVAAGGNAVLRFPDAGAARAFTAAYTRWLLDEAPGLEVAVAHQDYGEGGLAAALRQLLGVALPLAKTERLPSMPLGGLGVTAACRETGRPAAGTDPQDASVPLSAAMLRARAGQVQGEAAKRWRPYLQGAQAALHARGVALGWDVAFPDQLEGFRSKDELSMIAVVHVDGNAVGQRINAWLERCQQARLGDGEVLEQYREWSAALDRAGKEALHAVMQRVASAVVPVLKKEGSEGGRESLEVRGTEPDLAVPLPTDGPDGPYLLPVRPVLLGGDDLTFLTDARIALDLAAAALAAFERVQVPHLEPGAVHACAGVALIGTRAPILRGYELAERLCGSAKQRARDEAPPGNVSALDWHIGLARPGEDPKRLRQRQYQWAAWELTCRPYLLGTAAGPEPRTWQWLARELLGGSAKSSLRGPVWSEHRSKAKQLARLAREGRQAVRETLQAWQAVDGNLRLPAGIEDGFYGRRTPLLDAVELLDLHLPLDREGEGP